MKILLGLSGGVDSAYAARLLIDEGHTVEGAILVMHEHTEIAAAEAVARDLGIRLHIVDCTEPFDRIIKENFVREYLGGRTPNPCILCNEQVKFKYLHLYAKSHGFDKIATGHYASIGSRDLGSGERLTLIKAEDSSKDQTYMLYRLSEEILADTAFPLGNLTKDKVREGARLSGISSADRKDSLEICFLPDGNYAEYIEKREGPSPQGNFIDQNGKILGTHKGIIRYTVGQRKGLGISLGERAFVTAIDPIGNTVTLSPSMNGRQKITVSDLVFSGIKPEKFPMELELTVKLRYSAREEPVRALIESQSQATLIFDTPVKAAPGQSAVLYLDNAVAFGGIIG